MVMENHLVVLLLSVVILIVAFYGYTVEQKIFQIKNDLLKHEKEIKEVEEVKDDLESTKQELKQLKVELKAMHTELTEVKVDLESTRKEHKEVNEELESTKKEVTKVKVELESTKNEVKQVELELGSTRKELKQVKVELESKKNEVKQVKVELDTTKKEVKQVKAELDKIKTESCRKKNLALQKKCGQSSYMNGYECGLAVDGNFNTVIHTTFVWKNNANHGESNPYWWVDLESSCVIKLIKIYNRRDCCGKRFRNIEVTIGNSLSSMKVCWFYHGAAVKGEIISIPCREPMVARYVKVMMKDQNTEETILNFAEIQVFS